MPDPQNTSGLQPTPVAMRSGDSDQFLSLVNKKLSGVRGKQNSAFLDTVNAKLGKIRETQPTPPKFDSAKFAKEQHPDLKQWNPSWLDRIKAVGTQGYIGAVQGWGPSLTRDEHIAYDSLTTPQKVEYARKQRDDNALLAVFTGNKDSLTHPGSRGAVDLTQLMTNDQQRNHANTAHFLGGVSGFTSPESVVSQLEFVVGSELAGPLVGGALGWTKIGPAFDSFFGKAAGRLAEKGLTKTARLVGSIKAEGTVMSAAMMGPVVKDLGTSILNATMHGDSTDPKHAEGQWGDILANVTTLVGMHYGMKGLGHEAGTSGHLNEIARANHGVRFGELSDENKADVLWEAAATDNPKFKKRVDQEEARLKTRQDAARAKKEAEEAEKNPPIDRTGSEAREYFLEIAVQEAWDRRLHTEAAKKVFNQIIQQRAAEEHYRQVQAEAEARIHAERQRQYEVDKAHAEAVEGGTSPRDARGFPINDQTNPLKDKRGTFFTTNREQYPVHAPGGEPAETWLVVTDLRTVQSGPIRPEASSAIERPIQEYAEQAHGKSFSNLPLDQQRMVASHFERTQPEKWDAFKATKAYQDFQGHADLIDKSREAIGRYIARTEGSGEELAPGADPHIGVARLLLERTDVTANVRADPEMYKGLNDFAMQHFGKSFDSMGDGEKPAALAGYLREKPDAIEKLTTPDVTRRMRNGQHIDVANMEAALRDQEQVQTLMAYRDVTRAAMDEQFAGESVRRAREENKGKIQEIVKNAPAANTSEGEDIAARAKGLTQIAERISLAGIKDVNDLFEVEAAIRKIPAIDRTPDMQAYLDQARQVRTAAENQMLRDYHAGLVSQMRIVSDEPAATTVSKPIRKPGRAQRLAWASNLSDEAIELAAREIANLSDQKFAAQRLAMDNSGEYATPEQLAKAVEYQAAADFAERKEVAVTAAAMVAGGAKAMPASDSIPTVVGRASYVKLNSGEEVPVHYAVVEMSDLIASHEPANNFSEDARFPAELQPRDYRNNKEAQAAVSIRANAPDVNIYHSNSVRATDGPPVVRKDGVVLSGNGREQSAELAVRNRNWEAVRTDLLTKAQQFGINPEEITKMKNPILVRVMDAVVTDPAELARYGTEMNQDAGQGMSANERRAALSRLLTDDVVERMANIFKSISGDVTLRDAMRARSPELAKVLSDAGLVDPTKRAEYFTEEGELGEEAKTMIEEALAGITVSNPKVLVGASPSILNKLGRVGMDFLIMRSAGENWNLASYNTDAVQLVKRVQDASARLADLAGEGHHGSEAGASQVEKFLHPDRFTNSTLELSFDGQALHPPVHPVVEALALALEKSPRAYRELIGGFADGAREGGNTLYGAISPADVFNETIGAKLGLETITDEWGSVHGLPDSVKAEIIEARNPMAVEPVVHAETVRDDVQPDTSSVDDAVKSTEPKTVAEFRDALASHPNITGEQAQAMADVFETVLPNAIGESFADILRNRRLSLSLGGADGETRGYTDFIDEANTAIHLFEKAEPSTVMHEMFHFLRRYVKPEHQAALNEFVGAKPGAEWTVPQEEQAAQAFERYHFDGGRRRGALEKAFAVIHKAMQSVYDAVTGMGLAQPSDRIRQMFDGWYDWTRSERKPITARVDVDALAKATERGKVEIPSGAKVLDETAHMEKGAQNFVFTSQENADDFINKNSSTIRTYQMLDGKDGQFYVRATFQPGSKRLKQGGTQSIGELARQAKAIEDRLKQTKDPREEARLRAQLNSIENKLGVSTFVFGQKPEVRNTEATQLIYGMGGERPTVHEPTTPAQAMTERQISGDPTAMEVKANGDRAVRALPDETSGLSESDGTPEVPARAGESDGRDEAAGQSLRGRKRTDGGGGADISKPELNPLADMEAAVLKAPVRERGTPLADPAAWRDYVEALGLPEGTPPPTVRLPDDLRDMMIYPGQAEAIEVALSGLQQYDGVMIAAPTGSGKTWQGLAIADQLLGQDSSKVGLIVTMSQNLIHSSDGYIKTGQQVGVQVDPFPKDVNDVAGGGVYAATYSGIRGNKNILSIPWDFVIFDEAASARKWTESAQGKAVVMLGHAAKKAVYMSATPWHTALEVGYAHKLGMWSDGGFFEWGRQFGLREMGPNKYAGGYAPKKMMKLRQQLIERGQWVSLHRDLDGVEGHVAMVEQTPEVQQGVLDIRKAFSLARKIFTERGQTSMMKALAGHEVIYLKRFIESARLPEVLAKAKEAISDGWRPVIFSEYRSGSPEEGMEMFKKLPPGIPEMLNKLMPRLPNVVDAVREALGPDAAIFAGDANELREDEREAFLAGKKRGLYATYAAGGTGVGFHDKVGDKPRLGLFMGLPWSGLMFEQSLGRTWRYGTKSNVANIFFTSDTLPEMKLLATKILPRMRALKASVYGEDMESSLSKALRESSGIPEDVLAYEEGGEIVTDAAHFETKGKGVGYTSIADLKLPKAKDAMHKGMKYKTQPKRLYQGPKDPMGEDAHNEFEALAKELFPTLPPQMRRAVEANRVPIQAAAVDAAKRAVPGVEAPREAIRRVTKDNVINAKLMYMAHDVKQDSRAVGGFVKTFIRIFNTAGDRAVWRYMEDEGMGKEGKEIQRKLIERQLLITKHRGEMMAKVADFTDGMAPHQHSLAVRVIEGKEKSTDPGILKAVEGYRKLFADVLKKLGDAGAVFKAPDQNGKMVSVPWSQFRENPQYWPHMWDWNEKLTFHDAQGKPYIKTLGEIHDMKPGEERDKLIEAYAAKRGINRVDAHNFFAKKRRTIKLQPNLERTRETELPGYDTSMRAVGIYINQVSEMLANIATVGQEREKINPAIMSLPTKTMRMVDSIVTADLNPIQIGADNNRVLRLASQWVVITKMGMSVLKLPTHVMLKTPLVTNMRSLVGGMFEFAKSPLETTQMAREAGILTDYVRQAMMMEYGLHENSGLDRKLLTATGFTSSIWLSRVVAAATGRHFLTVHAEPMLRRNPSDPILRRKLSDLYGYSDEDLNRIAKDGINEHDVKRAMIAAADWTTGSGRASELPPALRAAGDDHPITGFFRGLLRISYLLKTYAFKTSSLVNRTVFDELKQGNVKPMMRLLVAGGASGLALNMLQMGVNSVANPKASDEQKRRFQAIKDHPQGLLWLEGANLSYALGLYPAKVLFDRLGTYEEGDLKKSTDQKRLENAFKEDLGGILFEDGTRMKDYAIKMGETVGDDGVNHRETPGERRVKLTQKLMEQEIAPVRAVEGAAHIIHHDDGESGSGYVPHRRAKVHTARTARR